MAHDTVAEDETFPEQLANCITHGLGLVAAVAGMVALMVSSALSDNGWRIVGYAVYGTTLVVLYAASTLYHSILHPKAKPFLRALDHSAILLLIAGTYTPFLLVNLRGPWGWSLFGAVWGAAIVGIVLRATVRRHAKPLFVTIYLVMGWSVVVAIKPVVTSVAPAGIALLLAGGLAYSAGVLFYLWRSLPYHHALWHLFVLAGSTLHFIAVYRHAAPMGLAG